MRLSERYSWVGRPIAFYPDLVPILGGIKPTLLFCQLYHCGERFGGEEFFHSLQEIRDETGLTEEELDSARKKLRDLGVLTERYARLEHKLYFRFSEVAFVQAGKEWFPDSGEVMDGNPPITPDGNTICIGNREDKERIETDREFHPIPKETQVGTRKNQSKKDRYPNRRGTANTVAPSPSPPKVSLDTPTLAWLAELVAMFHDSDPSWAIREVEKLRPDAELRSRIFADVKSRVGAWRREQKKVWLSKYLESKTWLLPYVPPPLDLPISHRTLIGYKDGNPVYEEPKWEDYE